MIDSSAPRSGQIDLEDIAVAYVTLDPVHAIEKHAGVVFPQIGGGVRIAPVMFAVYNVGQIFRDPILQMFMARFGDDHRLLQ